MPLQVLKSWQERAVQGAVNIFDRARETLDTPGIDDEGRATAIAANGYLLIEAPTGAGKTLMAGNVVARLSGLDKVVWFWYAPFKGVVDQTASFLRDQLPGLRLRTLGADRAAVGTRAGDVFVTTWQLVATKVRDRRSVRQDGEQNVSIDTLIVALREMGFRIGVVIDEAHHGFHGETQAARFFRETLRPEYTILITATPDDRDIEDFRQRMQISELHRMTLSRADAVGPGPEAGLIKNGVKCIAWRVEEGTEVAIDFEKTALREGAALHQFLRAELQRAGINLTPLMLVQVDSKPKSVERAKEHLLALGFVERQIAVHTADEPDAGLLAIANDESREVLIFKMAVALGFDAPRAWTLVSMRAAQDEDFGVQLVGRILRVHRRLQGRLIPESLRYGYVLLADMDAQQGLDAAGQRINRLRTAYATVSPTTIVVQVGARTLVQTLGLDGQMTLLPAPPPGAIFLPPALEQVPDDQGGVGTQTSLFSTGTGSATLAHALVAALRTPPPSKRYTYILRDGMPRKFKTQDIPDHAEVTEDQCAHHFAVEAMALWNALEGSQRVQVHKRTVEIFSKEVQSELSFAAPSIEEMMLRAQKELLRYENLNAKVLRRALLTRLRVALSERQVSEASNDEWLGGILAVLLSQNPRLLREAYKRALAERMEVYELPVIPDSIEYDTPLPASIHNVYGVQPPKLNSWEREFGERLDADDSGAVLWWHRNEPDKDWSINTLLESGVGFYPDFIVGMRERNTHQNGLLADTKFYFEHNKQIPKLVADHQAYGRVMILAKNDADRLAVAGFDPKTNQPRLLRPFRVLEAVSF